ncbi:hypothetical protein HMPREF0432_01421 [Gemella morbillorum M424]|nr:hypothetical protein HMPREF0432_01421 [Gemella morbillorum M424]
MIVSNADLLYSEQESGKNTNRPILDKMLNSIRANDKVIIASLDKLSRNYKNLKEIIQIIQITKDKRKEYFFVTLKIFLANPLLFYFLLCTRKNYFVLS